MKILDVNEQAYRKCYGISLQGMFDSFFLEQKVLTNPVCKEHTENDLQLPEDIRFLVLIGFGDGRFVREIAGRMKNCRMTVYEPDLLSFLATCCNFDVSDLINKVDIVLGDRENDEMLYSYWRDRIDILDYNHLFIKYTPGNEILYPGLLKRVVNGVKKALTGHTADLKTSLVYSRTQFKNYLYAISILRYNATFGSLLQQIPDRTIPIILVGAGPSLEKNAPKLALAKGKAFIIACTRAMHTLKKYGIETDLIGMVDMEEGHDYCVSDEERKYSVLFSADAALDIQRNYRGKGIYFGLNRHKAAVNGLENEIGEIYTGGSVITYLFSLFVTAGFRRFIFAGEDLAYSEEGVSHSGEWQDEMTGSAEYIEGIDGKKVRSRGDWMIFRQFLEEQIHNHPEIRVVDATEGGALIHGTEVMTLEDAIDQLTDTVYSIEKWIKDLPKGTVGRKEEVMAWFMDIDSSCAGLQPVLGDAIALNCMVSRHMDKGTFDTPLCRDLCVEYDKAYQKVLKAPGIEVLKEYCADVIFGYSEKAQYLNRDDTVRERLKLEKEFFENLRSACSELRSYIRGLIEENLS